MEAPPRARAPSRWLFLVGAALVGGVAPLAELAGAGLVGSFIVFVGLAAVVLLLYGLVATLQRATRPGAGFTIVAAILLLGSSYAGLRSRWPIRRAMFEALAERFTPVTRAIERYEAEHGSPPPSLEALVPAQLTELPGTGMLLCRTFKYRVFEEPHGRRVYAYDLGATEGAAGMPRIYDHGARDHALLLVSFDDDRPVAAVDADRLPWFGDVETFDAKRWRDGGGRRSAMARDILRERRLRGLDMPGVEAALGPPDDARTLKRGTWELLLPCSAGGMNWDVFFYWPGSHYPTHIYGGSVERFGDWAYVHE